ncbi:NAD(P)/FAD-dependent oxidoreductase [Cryomorphaceae bacterium 1068]|nr:NAD(P)/FAD-dependent oxidoreductase [Cryomorphaceae bacterium 1068]
MTIIVGAGISGLLTAYRLHQAGLAYTILEARERLGGRINTISTSDGTPVEMGATWFGNQHQHLIALLDELGLGGFEQYMKGTAFFQPFSTSPAESIQVPSQPPSYRIAGGTSQIIRTLFQKLDHNKILLNQAVKDIRFHENGVRVVAKEVFEADRVVLCLPPKLWAKNISIRPELPRELLQTALQTQTWMEDSIKLALSYAHPFWQEENLSGTLFSNTGPITEFYDHSNQERSQYALCGFVNSSYAQLSDAERRTAVMDQLRSVFGAKAEEFIDFEECVWSRENYTFAASETSHYPHQNNGNPIFRQSLMEGRLLLSGSETASAYPGYMDGAVHSANEAARKIALSVQERS